MAKTENNQDPGNPEQLLTKTLLVNENLEDADDNTVSTENEPVVVKLSCAHINKSVDANAVRKNVLRTGFDSLKCFSCKKDLVNDNDLLLCLKCGSSNCSNHAKQHFESPRSDQHFLAVKISDWNVWCYKCNTEIPVESGKLKEAIIVLKKEQNKPSKAVVVKQINTDSGVAIASSAMEPTAHCSRNNDISSCMAVTVGPKSVQSLPSARGLCNLGNTCFFNSVLQCLAQTPFLLELLMEISESGEKAILNIDNNSTLLVELEKWGPVTEALAITLTQITQGSGGAYPPAHLLDALRKRYRQFVGYNQHDAHELLRQLLDSVKTEDIRRYQLHILQHYGLSRKTNPEEVDEKKKTLAKELNQKLTEIVNIRPDPVFRGNLVSMHQCMKCHHKSEVVESFLDLSLPVSFLKTQAPSVTRRKNDFGEKTKSKHQKKKEKKAARKANRIAKIKRRLKDEENRNVGNRVIEMKDINESGYSSGKASSPVQNNGNSIPHENKNEILAEALNEINSSSNSMNGDSDISKLESPSSDVFNDENPSVDSKNNHLVNEHSPTVFPIVNNVDGHVVSSQSDELAPQQPEMRFRWLSPVVPPKTAVSSGSSSSDDEKDDDDDDDNNDNIDDDEAAEGDDDVSGDEYVLDDSEMSERGICVTLQPPSEYEENSIQACLSEFTACEVLTGNNRLKCESCSERQTKATGEKKPVYQPITKQLLIKSPPPVLILHLKRFEMRSAFSFSSVSLRKAEKVISFPLILDIGSFCSMNCEKLLVPGQKKILYSLYGVVEHSGSLNAGHYVAYVKVRKPAERNSYRRLFLPKPYSDHVENIGVDDLEQKINEHRTSEKQWYYISDSFVRSISEEEVLHKQAYLLFYERIL